MDILCISIDMMPGPGMRPNRKYAYGEIKRMIVKSMDEGKPKTAAQIVADWPTVDPMLLRHNVSTQCSVGFLKNVGTRKAALYILQGKTNV